MSEREVLAEKKQYPTSANAYEIYENIGSGAFARVYRAGVKGTSEEVAIKLLDLELFNTSWDEIRKEVLVMRGLHHSNVVDVLCAFVDGQVLWIVMPLMQLGSCANILKQIAPRGFKDEVLLATILREVLKGLAYFHDDSKIHRDIKAGNILINSQGEVKIGDFGVAGTLIDNGQRRDRRQTFTGTPCWMAPEVMEQMSGYDTKADIWSFGITAMELAFGKAPYADFQPMKVLLMTLKEEPPTIDFYKDESVAKFSSAFRSLIDKCLKKKPKKRAAAQKLLTHRFFQKAKDSKYIIDHIVKKLPAMKSGGVPLLNPTLELAAISGKSKEKPVDVGPWSFDMKELKEALEKDGPPAIPPKIEEGDADEGDDFDASYSDGSSAVSGQSSPTAGGGGHLLIPPQVSPPSAPIPAPIQGVTPIQPLQPPIQPLDPPIHSPGHASSQSSPPSLFSPAISPHAVAISPHVSPHVSPHAAIQSPPPLSSPPESLSPSHRQRPPQQYPAQYQGQPVLSAESAAAIQAAYSGSYAAERSGAMSGVMDGSMAGGIIGYPQYASPAVPVDRSPVPLTSSGALVYEPSRLDSSGFSIASQQQGSIS